MEQKEKIKEITETKEALSEPQIIKKVTNSQASMVKKNMLEGVNNHNISIPVILSNPQDTFKQENIFDFSLVSLIFIIIGWSVIYGNAKKLATRNETKSIIDDAVSLIEKLEQLTVNYWLSGRQNRLDTDAYLLLANTKLQTLNSRLIIINNREVSTLNVDLAKISEFMTLNCEDVDRCSSEEKRSQVQSFLEEANNSVESLYDEFQVKYKPSFTFFK